MSGAPLRGRRRCGVSMRPVTSMLLTVFIFVHVALLSSARCGRAGRQVVRRARDGAEAHKGSKRQPTTGGALRVA